MNRLKEKFCFIIVLVSFGYSSKSQDIERRTLHINEANGSIKVDGVLDDEAWTSVSPARDFQQNFPYDSALSETQCEVYLTYDKQNIYVGTKCYDPDPTMDYSVLSLRRDYKGNGIDGISVIFDTFLDQTNAFTFGINPFGVRREGFISNGGSDRNSFSLDWDNKWFGESKREDGFWTSEMAIPFKTIRFKEGSSRWNFNTWRVDGKTNEKAVWNHVPRNFNAYTLSFLGELIWDKPLPKPGSNISIIPYVTSGLNKDFEANTKTNLDKDLGGDVKVAISASLNLDMTFNPDFSQVEVDRQVTNIDRFEIFFPERRQFFLENADLFAAFGNRDARPFFSRRIGVSLDTAQGLNVQNRIIGGMRLSGKLNNRLRMGLMNMQAAQDGGISLPSINYTVAAFQQQVFSRSNISILMVNKQSFKETFTDKLLDQQVKYNRLVGVDYNLASQDNKWTGKVFYHRSFQEQDLNKQYSHGANLEYNSINWQFKWEHSTIGDNYNAEVGFVRRTGVSRAKPEISYRFYPKKGIINYHGPEIQFEYLWDGDGRTDRLIRYLYRARLQNNSSLFFNIDQRFTRLLRDFNPTRSSGEDIVKLAKGSEYNYVDYFFGFRSDPSRKLSIRLSHEGGEFYNGHRWNIQTTTTYRFQPYGNLSVQYNYTRINLPDPYPSRSIHLIGPRVDLTLSRKVFFTNFVQFNTQNETVNLNARFQWRFKPVSDIFLVYTDNYFFSLDHPNDNWLPKARAIVFKMTYWLNL